TPYSGRGTRSAAASLALARAAAVATLPRRCRARQRSRAVASLLPTEHVEPDAEHSPACRRRPGWMSDRQGLRRELFVREGRPLDEREQLFRFRSHSEPRQEGTYFAYDSRKPQDVHRQVEI